MTPFKRATVPESEIKHIAENLRLEYDEDPIKFRLTWDVPAEWTFLDILQDSIKNATKGEVWLNDLYQVFVTKVGQLPGAGWPPMVHLSIKRIDREPIRDWRHFQQIKSDLVGPECEAVELFPAESRVVDTANQYHLWCFSDPKGRWPFGFEKGVRQNKQFGKAKQRPL